MTKQSHLKNRVRARMEKTGESYTVARRHVIAKAEASPAKGPEQFHLPGNVPGTTALRVLFSAAGLRPRDGENVSEALLFGIAGGVGAGVFTFRYEQEDFSSCFIAGRHLWQDDLAYLQSACARVGAQVEIKETGGAKSAERQLRDALQPGRPVVAWVDMAGLPRHVSPQEAMGGQYHVVTTYEIDDAKSEVLIGDLADAPDRVPTDVFAQARMRIKKQKNRLLWMSEAPREFDLRAAATAGMAACHDALAGRGAVPTPGGKGMAKNFTLDAFAVWGDRLHGGDDKQSWARMFPRGVNLWRGLTSIYSFIHYGTGGGLCRPLYAEFFDELHQRFGAPAYRELKERYEQLGEAWDDLGAASLPDGVEMFERFRSLSVERAELTLAGGVGTATRLEEILSEVSEMERKAAEGFPLSERECDELRADLQRRVRLLHREEVAAHERLAEAAASTP